MSDFDYEPETLQDKDRRIGALKAEVAALRLDKERIDWLIENIAWPMEDTQGWFVAFYESGPEHGFHPTAREAIDAAIAAHDQAAGKEPQ